MNIHAINRYWFCIIVLRVPKIVCAKETIEYSRTVRPCCTSIKSDTKMQVLSRNSRMFSIHAAHSDMYTYTVDYSWIILGLRFAVFSNGCDTSSYSIKSD